MLIKRNFEDSQLVLKLTNEELLQAYDEVRKNYLIEDAKTHTENLNINLNDKDIYNLVSLFEEKHNCNSTENDTWDLVIDLYIKERNDYSDEKSVEKQDFLLVKSLDYIYEHFNTDGEFLDFLRNTLKMTEEEIDRYASL
jgi:hypothetical protein